MPSELVALPPNIFRAYDIRGVVGTDLDSGSIELIGKSLASLALDAGETTLLFGADGRLTSPALKSALLRGILSTGCNVVDLGIIPTPLLYFAAYTSEWTSGIMLTASHNPPEYNGIKIIHRRSCLTPEQIQQIREHAEAGKFREGCGSLTQRNLKSLYIARLVQDVRLQRRLKVVVDCANAVPGLIAPELFAALGCDVVPLYCDMDGHFPNHHPDPTIDDNMQDLIAQVVAHQADLGIALDGDGDRVVVVTNKGHVIDTDRLLMLLIRDIVPRYQSPNVVFDVKCSTLLTQLIRDCGGNPVMSRSGHSFMKKTMQETGAVVGAEFSAHVFIKDRWYGYDDGLYVAARFLELLSRQSSTAEDLLESLPKSVVTPELRIQVADEHKFLLMEKIKKMAAFPQGSINILDGVRVDFADGWGLIRASNTTPALLLRFEATSRKSLLAIQQMFRELLLQVDDMLEF
ncbi:MAG: phosphomannomutase/phosphoglucomutase [Gammaproteobacteria bacterium]|nr:phosphomannomutase/phosphoglucomutase [Gammaproteobacteria bacterium]MDP2139558.1 phosphomannomutase/phosphoglucomutase [Gammaproteobacteria bacterium]MDP2346531.1 phosphomannomutase/phosphoglucomutase [Gammaproteobacteria bacterium]